MTNSRINSIRKAATVTCVVGALAGFSASPATAAPSKAKPTTDTSTDTSTDTTSGGNTKVSGGGRKIA